MKATTTNRASMVQGGNRTALENAMKGTKITTDALGLLVLIADMLDEIASGKNLYMVIGSTQNGSAFSMSVKGDMSPAPCYAATLEELGTQALNLL